MLHLESNCPPEHNEWLDIYLQQLNEVQSQTDFIKSIKSDGRVLVALCGDSPPGNSPTEVRPPDMS